MKCSEFDRVQIASLLGEASPAQTREAEKHATVCAPCRRDAERDARLENAFAESGARELEEGLRRAQRKLDEALRDRRAFFCAIEGPFGRIHLARTEKGLCRVSFRRTDEAFARELEERGLLADHDPERVGAEAHALREYFEGRRKELDLPIDLRLATPFQKRVLQATRRIPFGRVATYGEIARRIGRPAARRAVGGALGRNPVAIVIPCHRVVAAEGIGGYTGGVEIKKRLMRIEGIAQ